MDQSQYASRCRRNSRTNQPMIQAVSTGTILSDLNFDENLIGVGTDNPDLHDGLVTISASLRKHQYLSWGHSDASDAGLAQMYKQTMKEFRKTQMDRQAMGLRTNTSRASSAGLKRIIDCHSDVLQHVLDSSITVTETLQEQYLCHIHSKLCPDISQSGEFRVNKVRASNTSFVSPKNIRSEVKKFSLAVERFQTELANSSTDITDEKQLHQIIYQKIAIAAIVLYGINDIHPFTDGNGRTARILMNVVLRKLLGLPFPITITATPPQRQEYVNELRACRSRFQVLTSKQQRMKHNASKNKQTGIPIFQNMTIVILKGVLHAVKQVQSQLESKTKAAAIEEEDKIARRVRERAATGQCVICLEDNPDVATLCCGQVVHMGCLAEWLSNQGSCITCRKPMRRLTQRQRPDDHSRRNDADDSYQSDNDAAIYSVFNFDNQLQEETTSNDDSEASPVIENGDDDERYDDDDTDGFFFSDSDDSPPIEDTNTIIEFEESDTSTDDDDDDDDVNTQFNFTEDTHSTYSPSPEDEISYMPPQEYATTYVYDLPQEDTTNNTTAYVGTGDDSTINTYDEDTIEDTTTYVDSGSQRNIPPFCCQCQRNRSAVDCVNHCCGACCQVYGPNDCRRHHTYFQTYN